MRYMFAVLTKNAIPKKHPKTMQWYYTHQGQQLGPVTDEELKRIASLGDLKPEDYVWNETLGTEWVLASLIPGLCDPSKDTPRPTPTPLGVAVGLSMGGLTPNRELMTRARASLQGKWGLCVGVFLLYFVITILPGAIISVLFKGNGSSQDGVAFVPFISAAYQWIVTGPLFVGLCLFFLKLARLSEVRVGILFEGFNLFGKSLATYLLTMLFIALWTLLLIVPGIIAAYSYAMTFFILADDPSIKPLEAIRRSKEMMKGNKWKLACLQGRFIGWYLLALLTCGIGLLWVAPYFQTAYANFYEDVKDRAPLPS